MKLEKLTGLLMILFGALYLVLQILNQLGYLDLRFYELWPLFIIALGLMFEAIYMLNKNYTGFLIPGGIITTIGLLHLFEVITRWSFAQYTWPIYILAPAIGLYHFSVVTRSKGAKTAAFILLLVTIFCGLIAWYPLFFGSLTGQIINAMLIIIVGVFILYTSLKPKQKL